MINYFTYILLIFSSTVSYCIGICICFDILTNKKINKVKAARLALIWPIIIIYFGLSHIFNIIFNYIKLVLGFAGDQDDK